VRRFLPIIAFNFIRYAGALAGIGWRTFLWTTGLGIRPRRSPRHFMQQRA
jgi:uncharacterized membrane protein YdjX (TVP38/TMEM64 family)